MGAPKKSSGKQHSPKRSPGAPRSDSTRAKLGAAMATTTGSIFNALQDFGSFKKTAGSSAALAKQQQLSMKDMSGRQVQCDDDSDVVAANYDEQPASSEAGYAAIRRGARISPETYAPNNVNADSEDLGNLLSVLQTKIHRKQGAGTAKLEDEFEQRLQAASQLVEKAIRAIENESDEKIRALKKQYEEALGMQHQVIRELEKKLDEVKQRVEAMMEHGKQRVQALHEAKSTLQSTLGEQEAALGEDKQRLLEALQKHLEGQLAEAMQANKRWTL